ncbi:LysR substrate-binding domain-containing protein [Pontivivens insulae]|uniref:Glycine cleavage system transcriptional activator n=1 Tax=Pontivivens insulae TaxID=1639689 RepID=A0A2R8AC89_9RHOB|nr:LysR substrate-binding domain-containing protein [Pontivivens insulae]RED13765.1 LysR family glycine cleavage system transcriptional activator [Pontivivens insulae]SPF29839.1 Glycine cleavage system transcriptional activator [Pontivivens insulae]
MQFRPSLPKSLDALRVFEAAARHGSFSDAARELLVTQAAVSRRIQALEHDLGMALFERAGRRVSLTGAGRRLSLQVGAALDYLEADLSELRGVTRAAPVSIAASVSVSHLWLAPRLRSFAQEEGAGPVHVLSTDSLAEVAHTNNDLTIIYSQGEHPDWVLTPLFEERLIPVAAPTLARPDREAMTLEDIARLPLLDYRQVRPQWITLSAWLRRAGLRDVPQMQRVFTSYVLAVEAALAGEGVLLGSLDLLQPQIRAGHLVPLGLRIETSGFGYYLGYRREGVTSPAAQHLHRWLLAPH